MTLTTKKKPVKKPAKPLAAKPSKRTKSYRRGSREKKGKPWPTLKKTTPRKKTIPAKKTTPRKKPTPAKKTTPKKKPTPAKRYRNPLGLFVSRKEYERLREKQRAKREKAKAAQAEQERLEREALRRKAKRAKAKREKAAREKAEAKRAEEEEAEKAEARRERAAKAKRPWIDRMFGNFRKEKIRELTEEDRERIRDAEGDIAEIRRQTKLRHLPFGPTELSDLGYEYYELVASVEHMSPHDVFTLFMSP